MKAHFFDLDTLITANNKVWIVDKNDPNTPLIRIEKHDFNLIKKGVYKNQNNKISFSGDIFWLPEELMNKIKIKTKSIKSDMSNLAFSMQEFMNKNLIENLYHEIKFENIRHLKNTTDDIYVICSKNTEKNYEFIIEKLKNKLEEEGLQIKKFYHISETFYNRDEDKISHKKVRLLIQHLLGYKTDINKFTSEEIKEYDKIEFYDDELSTIEMSKKSMTILEFLLSNTEIDLKEKIKDKIKKSEKYLDINLVTTNKINRFVKERILIRFPNLIKTFESFRQRF